jgi:predicted nucleic acid-binding protein
MTSVDLGLVDTNTLVYAFTKDAEFHAAARGCSTRRKKGRSPSA